MGLRDTHVEGRRVSLREPVAQLFRILMIRCNATRAPQTELCLLATGSQPLHKRAAQKHEEVARRVVRETSCLPSRWTWET